MRSPGHLPLGWFLMIIQSILNSPKMVVFPLLMVHGEHPVGEVGRELVSIDLEKAATQHALMTCQTLDAIVAANNRLITEIIIKPNTTEYFFGLI